jgi:hypothetical protein
MRSIPHKCIWLLASFVLWFCLLNHPVFAQSVTVQVLDGRNAKPIGKGTIVHIAFGNEPTHTTLTLHTSRDGEVEFDTEGAKAFWVGAVGYVACINPDSLPENYPVNKVIQTGLLSSNVCGQINPHVQPGTLLYFVRREGLAERLKNQSN